MRTLTVASWNMREGVTSEADPIPLKGPLRDKIAELIRSNEIDILALQEVDFSEDGHSRVLEAIASDTCLAHVASYKFSPSSFFRDGQSGVAIASRFPLEENAQVLLPNPHLTSDEDPTFRSFDKGLIGSRVRLSSDLQIQVFSVHLVPFRRFKKTGAEPELSFIWDELSLSIKSSYGTRYAVCGDFNTTMRQLIISRLQDGLRSAVDGRPTYEDLALDDILFNEGLRLLRVKLKTNFSDHKLCIAELAIDDNI